MDHPPAGYPGWSDVSSPDPSPHYPALWDTATHVAVIRERNRRRCHRYQKSPGSPIAGVVWCARCGHHMTRHTNRHVYYLRCAKHARQSVTGQPCHANYVKESAVIAAIAAYLDDLITNPAALDQALATINPSGDHRPDLADVETRLQQLEARRERLALALAAGDLDPQMYRKTDDVLIEDVVKLTREQQRLHTLVAAAPDPEIRRQALSSLAPLLPDLLTQAPPAQARALLQTLGLRVEVDSGAITSIRLT